MSLRIITRPARLSTSEFAHCPASRRPMRATAKYSALPFAKKATTWASAPPNCRMVGCCGMPAPLSAPDRAARAGGGSMKAPASTPASAAPSPVPDALRNFDALPAAANVRLPVVVRSLRLLARYRLASCEIRHPAGTSNSLKASPPGALPSFPESAH